MIQHAGARPFFVLVVDDDRAAAEILTRSLRLGGYDARAAYGAQRALALLRQWHADAAVLNVVQGTEGLELARKLRQISTRPLLLVALTGKEAPAEIAPRLAAEFNYCLRKPVNPDELLALLDARA
jgi:CheY-like chemotaxis protein